MKRAWWIIFAPLLFIWLANRGKHQKFDELGDPIPQESGKK